MNPPPRSRSSTRPCWEMTETARSRMPVPGTTSLVTGGSVGGIRGQTSRSKAMKNHGPLGVLTSLPTGQEPLHTVCDHGHARLRSEALRWFRIRSDSPGGIFQRAIRPARVSDGLSSSWQPDDPARQSSPEATKGCERAVCFHFWLRAMVIRQAGKDEPAGQESGPEARASRRRPCSNWK